MEWEWDRAERAFQRAIELDPSYTWAYYTYALQLTVQGRLDEAIEQWKLARQIDPVSPSPVWTDLGYLYSLKGDLESAVRAWEESLELAPNDHRTHRHIGNHLCRTGSFEAGIEEIERALESVPGEERLMADLGYCHAIAGHPDEARDYLRRIEANAESRYVDPTHRSLVHLGLGETDRAIELLRRAYELHSPVLGDAVRDPRWESIRSDPRFEEIVSGMGIYDLLPPERG